MKIHLKPKQIILNSSLIISLVVNLSLIYFGLDFLIRPGKYEFTCGTGKVLTASQNVVQISGDDGDGSGFWVSEKLLVTNNHVVRFNPNLKIISHSKRTVPAEVIGTDTLNDLALLRANAGDSSAELEAFFGSNHQRPEPLKWRKQPIRLADQVYAIGYPQGTDLSLTQGIVSGIHRDDDTKRTYIQTDSAINPGNSGGPLIDRCGQVVGINTMTLRDAQNVGYAITSDDASKKVSKMIAERKNATQAEISYGYPSDQAEVVAKYYDTLSTGDFEASYAYYHPKRQSRLPFENWKRGFEKTYVDSFEINLKSIEKTDQPNVIKVEFSVIQLESFFDVISKNYSGTWTLQRDNDLWKLDESNIKEIIEEPLVDQPIL